MIDIHSHILANIDDGSTDMEMSIDMARQYIENNIHKVIATPHFIERNISTDLNTNKMALKRLKEELNKANIPLEVYLGNELYVSMSLIKDIKEGKASSLNSSRYILIELPMNDLPIYLDNLIYEILIQGYIPILAHPERNLSIIEDPNILYKYIKKGTLAQLNLPSLSGRYGKSVQDTAKTILAHNLVHFVGTDAHSNKSRSPNVKTDLEVLREIISEDYYQMITVANAMLLLENKEIQILEPLEVKKNIGVIEHFISKYFKK